MSHKVLQPAGWQKPRGYSNGVVARGRQIFVAGQIGWDAFGQLGSDDFARQARQALSNIVAILREAGAKGEHIVRLTWYVTDKAEYLQSQSAVGIAYREIVGAHYPAMTVVEVSRLLEEGAKVEIEATAVLPVSE